MIGRSVLEDLLTVEEAATRLGVSPATVKRRCAAGEIAATRIGRAWLIDAKALRLPPGRPRRRPAAAASALVDFQQSLRHLRAQDLRRDLWVPDVLRFEDDLERPDELFALAAAKLDRIEQFDPPVNVPVPKSSFFLRNAVNLSLSDRLAYHAAVAALISKIEARTQASVYSARRSLDDRTLLRSGTLLWRQWRDAVTKAAAQTDGYVVETDITAYFDCISHTVLFQELQDLGAPKVILDPLREMLRTWSSTPNTGLPQGPDASRVLANFYLHAIDEVMASLPQISYFRYMDDIRIVASRRQDAISALRVLDGECRKRNLSLSTKKTHLLSAVDARQHLVDGDMDAAQYAFDVSPDPLAVRTQLRRVFKSAIKKSGEVDTRRAKFSIFRLRALREGGEVRSVLKRLEHLAPLGWLVAAYLLPWMRKPWVVSGVCKYLTDPERNTSDFLSTWLLAALLDEPNAVTLDVIHYSRSVAFDRAQSSYHRAIALNVVALGRRGRDIAALRDVVAREYDPEVVRAAVVALRRIAKLDRATAVKAQRVAGVATTIRYLQGRNDLPSLINSDHRNQIEVEK